VGLEILDLVYRLERRFGVKIRRDELMQIFDKNDPPDVLIGQLFDFVRGKAPFDGVLDEEMDAEAVWLMFQRAVADWMGGEPEEVTKDRWLIHDLGLGSW
jgi:acyl carrier protein